MERTISKFFRGHKVEVRAEWYLEEGTEVAMTFDFFEKDSSGHGWHKLHDGCFTIPGIDCWDKAVARVESRCTDLVQKLEELYVRTSDAIESDAKAFN